MTENKVVELGEYKVNSETITASLNYQKEEIIICTPSGEEILLAEDPTDEKKVHILLNRWLEEKYGKRRIINLAGSIRANFDEMDSAWIAFVIEDTNVGRRRESLRCGCSKIEKKPTDGGMQQALEELWEKHPEARFFEISPFH